MFQVKTNTLIEGNYKDMPLNVPVNTSNSSVIIIIDNFKGFYTDFINELVFPWNITSYCICHNNCFVCLVIFFLL